MKKTRREMKLQNQLIILFVGIVAISVGLVGAVSYAKAKKEAMQAIEQRLERETDMMYELVQNLLFMYIGDQEQFMERVNEGVRKQQAELMQDGMPAEFFLVAETVRPFYVSRRSSLLIPETLIEHMKKNRNGVSYTVINGKYSYLPEYTGIKRNLRHYCAYKFIHDSCASNGCFYFGGNIDQRMWSIIGYHCVCPNGDSTYCQSSESNEKGGEWRFEQ